MERKVLIDFNRGWMVGGACVSKNKNMVSAQSLENNLTKNDEIDYVDRHF